MKEEDFELPLKVYCAKCKKHIYNLLELPTNCGVCYPQMFEQIDENMPIPKMFEPLKCPLCNKIFLFSKKGYCLLTDIGYLPR